MRLDLKITKTALFDGDLDDGHMIDIKLNELVEMDARRSTVYSVVYRRR